MASHRVAWRGGSFKQESALARAINGACPAGRWARGPGAYSVQARGCSGALLQGAGISMLKLVLGLVLFFAAHLPAIARGSRERFRETLGVGGYRGLVSLLSLAGLALIIWGFIDYRDAGMIQIWYPPIWTRHLAFLLNLPVFVLLIAAYTPGHIKAKLGHPMLAAVKLWALAHLLANGDLGGMLIFGAFLAWAVLARISAKRRGERAIVANPSWIADIVAVVGGVVIWALVLTRLHALLIGVPLLH